MKNYQTWKDGLNITRLINHNQDPVLITKNKLIESAQLYLKDMAMEFMLEDSWVKNCVVPLKRAFNKDEKASLYLGHVKTIKRGSVVVFPQTFAGIPLWAAGITVVTNADSGRILSSTNSITYGIHVTNLDGDLLEKIRTIDARTLGNFLGLGNKYEKQIRIHKTNPYIFRYEGAKRFGHDAHEISPGMAFDEYKPKLPLPKVGADIEEGAYYLALEVLFSLPWQQRNHLNWRAFIKTDGQVLFCEAAIDNATGKVFLHDPATQSGDLANNPNSTNATLNPLRTAVNLLGLVAPVNNQQSLTGEFVTISDVEVFTVAPPTAATPAADFSYDARTNNFAAVNAYYHCDAFFRMIQNMGFTVTDYFDGSTFPVIVDHRGRFGTNDGIEVNASCSGTVGVDGISMVDFELATTTDNAAHPMGIACDWRIVLHELGGHGILWDQVSHANFGFSHSAGDSFAAILNDPETQLTGADRFLTFPWVSGVIARRHDRAVASGWGWGGANDVGGYSSEQVLSTTLFRLYRSLGGDSTNLARRLFSARFTGYLILKAVESLTPVSNPANATAFELALESADGFDFDPINPSEHHASGAYYKVIRWAFEKQGLFRAAGVPVTSEGAPPAVDVYINDGREGEYQYLANHWDCQDIWNRIHADGSAGHEEPITGQPNFAYVRIKNRGTSAATHVVVKGFHCLPGVGLVYPDDWQAMTTPQLNAPNLAAHDAVGTVVGPFEWTPSQVGHECMFFSVSATGDPSNIDGRITGSIPEWRLVPNDNNIAQRNVHPVAGGGGIQGLLESFANLPFWIRNHERKRVKISFEVSLPKFLKERGWTILMPKPFMLKSKSLMIVKPIIKPGKNFKASDISDSAGKMITISVLYNGMLYGGMSYPVEPRKIK